MIAEVTSTAYYLFSDTATGYICCTVIACVIGWKVIDMIEKSI